MVETSSAERRLSPNPDDESFRTLVESHQRAIRVHCYTTWDTAVQRDVFLERGYAFERMLADLGEIQPQRTLSMEKVF